MAFEETATSSEQLFKKKYSYNNLRQKHGVSKPLAERILNYVFGNKIISFTPDREKRKFTAFVDDSISDSVFEKFRDKWGDVFDIYRSNNKKKTK